MSKLQTLTQDLLFADDAYQQGQPVMTDSEYEKKYAKLQKLEAKTGVVLPNSPTQKITDVKVTGLETVVHSTPMLSLAKTTNLNELQKWFKTLNSDILIEPKLDGITLILRYSQGELVDAITRGNGLEGSRVFTLASTLNLPLKIDFKGELELRGEVFVPFAEFDRVNNGQYANPRSLAAGTMMMLDVEEASKRGLEIKIFDLVSVEGKTFETRQGQKEFIFQLGFPTVSGEFFEEFDKITSYCSKYETNTRKELPFPIDGLVLKCNSIEKSERLGTTGHHPLHSIAWKFSSEEAFTTMRDITVQIGKNGQVTPVAIFDPITIDGVEITRCTLHNPNFVYENGVRVGQKCVIARANDVIPKWIKSVPTDGDNELPKWKMPTECPSCGSPIKAEGPMAFCTGGDSCPAQLVEKIIHYCSRDAMDIEGLGESNIKLLFDEVFIKSPADLYSLADKADEIKELEGFGDKKLDKILESIENTKTQPLSRALYAINVPYLGRTNSRNLAAKFPTIDALMTASFEQLRGVDGIGEITAQNIMRFFEQPKTQILVERLKDAGVSMSEVVPEAQAELPLSGKTLVITGTLSMKRSEFEDMIRVYGGKPTGSVSKNTDFVILGGDQNGSSKHKKALDLGVAVISEDDFYRIVGKN